MLFWVKYFEKRERDGQEKEETPRRGREHGTVAGLLCRFHHPPLCLLCDHVFDIEGGREEARGRGGIPSACVRLCCRCSDFPAGARGIFGQYRPDSLQHHPNRRKTLHSGGGGF